MMGDRSTLLDVGKADLGPLRRIVESKEAARWVTAHLLECGHAYTVRGNKQPKARMRCPECRKARQHGGA
jgi:hypothetical protein